MPNERDCECGGEREKLKFPFYLINITIGSRPLNADIVVRVLGERGILSESGAVHEVEEIAVVGAEVQHGRGAGPAVPLRV